MKVLLTGEKSIAVFDKKPTVNSIAIKDPNGKTISSTQLSSRAIFVRCILSFIFQVTCSKKHKILINKNPKTNTQEQLACASTTYFIKLFSFSFNILQYRKHFININITNTRNGVGRRVYCVICRD